MAKDLYERIQLRAYEIWENEGRPEGAAVRHWEQATDDLAGDDEHETLQDLIDEDDFEDEERGRGVRPGGEVEITTGEQDPHETVRSVEGP
jgi:hypothetical protein